MKWSLIPTSIFDASRIISLSLMELSSFKFSLDFSRLSTTNLSLFEDYYIPLKTIFFVSSYRYEVSTVV